MGQSKTELFSEKEKTVAGFAKVLGHPARIAILQHLFETDSCICGDLVYRVGLAQPTISQHIKELKSAGLIKGKVAGTSVCYCIHKENWLTMKRLLVKFLDQDTCTKDQCC